MSSNYQLKVGRFSSHSQIVDLAGEGLGKTALDFGCHDGELAALLKYAGWTIDGLDCNEEALLKASRVCRRVAAVDVESADPHDFGTYDLLIFADILEHTASPLTILRRWVNAMDSQGSVIISIPNIAHAYVRLSLLTGRFNYQDRGILDRTHLRFFTLKTYKDLLEQAGLEIRDLRVTPTPIELLVPNFTQTRLWPSVDSLNAVLARGAKRILGYQFVALASPSRA